MAKPRMYIERQRVVISLETPNVEAMSSEALEIPPAQKHLSSSQHDFKRVDDMNSRRTLT